MPPQRIFSDLHLPASFIISRTTELVSLFRRLDPAALGWTAEISPDLPIPWINLNKKKVENIHQVFSHPKATVLAD